MLLYPLRQPGLIWNSRGEAGLGRVDCSYLGKERVLSWSVGSAPYNKDVWKTKIPNKLSVGFSVFGMRLSDLRAGGR